MSRIRKDPAILNEPAWDTCICWATTKQKTKIFDIESRNMESHR